jgi:phage terminase large subunit GpA-like protein
VTAAPPDPAALSLIQGWQQLWTPPVRLPLSAWAEANITLSSEYAARSTHLVLFPWQREVFDAFTDPTVSEIVMCCSTQLVKTLLLQCALAYAICEDPGPILLVQPNDDDAKTFSKERLSPMIRDNACLKGKVSESNHDGQNTIVGKMFAGGTLSLVGSIAPSNLARRSIRYLFCDEIDLYPISATKGALRAGDPIGLAEKRLATFGSRTKIIKCCSPTTAGQSAIMRAYQESDMRKYYVPCPVCNHFQILRWPQVKWDSSISRELQAATVRYECENSACNARWTDIERRTACQRGRWEAGKPFNKVAGFWISHLYSPWEKQSLPALVNEFLKAKSDREHLRVFINTSLAEVWQETGETPDDELLYSRREPYPHGDEAVVPPRGLFLTAAVDVQDNPPRLEVEVAAWGRGRERWSIYYTSITAQAGNGQFLPVGSPELWDQLAVLLARDWPHAAGAGRTLPIMAMGIDTGSRPKPVYDFTRRHPQLSYSPGTGLRLHAIRTVVPVKGTPDPLRLISSVSKEDAMKKQQGVRIIGIGTHCAKQEIYDLLKHVKPSALGEPVPGCYHFPYYDRQYFTGLCAEVRIVKPSGDVVYEKRGQRNEPLDLAVYQRGMAAAVGIDRFTEAQWRQMERAVGIDRHPVTGEVVQPVVGLDRHSSVTPPSAGVGAEADPCAPPGSDQAPAPPLPPPTPPPPPSTLSSTPPVARPVTSRPVRGRFNW